MLFDPLLQHVHVGGYCLQANESLLLSEGGQQDHQRLPTASDAHNDREADEVRPIPGDSIGPNARDLSRSEGLLFRVHSSSIAR